MPLLLKSTYVYTFTGIVIFATYGWWIFGFLGIEYFTGPEALTRIGMAIGTLIIAGYAFELAVLFAVGLISFKISENRKADFTVDERDRQIVYKSIYNSHLVLCSGIFLSIGALAMGFSAFWVFQLIVLAFLLSVVAELGTKFFLIRAGI